MAESPFSLFCHAWWPPPQDLSLGMILEFQVSLVSLINLLCNYPYPKFMAMGFCRTN